MSAIKPPAPAAIVRSRSGSQTRQRTRHIKIHLTEVEYAAAVERANRAGLSLSSMARITLLGGDAPVTRRPPVEKALLAQALGQLGKVGSNINQIAHAVNTGLSARPDRLERELEALRLVRDEIMKALGRDH